MDRRNFLKSVALATAAPIAFCESQNAEGKVFQEKYGFARKILMSDKLDPGDFARYERNGFWYIGYPGFKEKKFRIHTINEGEEFFMATGEFNADGIEDKDKCELEIQRQEDEIVSEIIFNKFVEDFPQCSVHHSGNIGADDMTEWFSNLEYYNLPVENINMHPKTYEYFKDRFCAISALADRNGKGKKVFEACSLKHEGKEYFWNAAIETFTSIPVGYILFSADKEFNGVIPIRQYLAQLRPSEFIGNKYYVSWKDQGIGVQINHNMVVVKLIDMV